MKTSALLAVASLAVLASFGARAESETDYAVKFDSTRSRAEVTAEARAAARADTTMPPHSLVTAPVRSTLDRSTVRDMAINALRNGEIHSGEIG